MLYLIGGIAGAAVLWRPAWGLALYFAALPLIRYLMAGAVEGQSPVALPSLIVALATLLRVLLPDQVSRSRATKFLVVVLVFVVASAAYFGSILLSYPVLVPDNLLNADQLNPFVFVSEGVLWLIGGILLLGMARIGTHSDDRALLYRAFLVQGGVFVAVLMVDALLKGKAVPGFWIAHSQENHAGLFAIFSEHNTFGAYCLLQAMLAAGLTRCRVRTGVWIGAGLAFFWVVLLAASLSMSSLAGLGLTLLTGILLFVARALRKHGLRGFLQTRRRMLVRSFVAGLGASVLLVAGYFMMDPALRHQRVDQRFAELTPGAVVNSIRERRWAPWVIALAMARDYPVYGIGMGRYYDEFKFYRSVVPKADRGYLFAVAEHENAHSYFLQLIAECGLLGLILFLGGVVAILRRCNWDDWVSGALGLAVISVLFVSVLQHPMLVELFFLSVVGIVGLCWAAPSPTEAATDRSSGRWLTGLIWVAIIALPLHIYFAWDDYPPEFQYGVYGTEQGIDGPYQWTSELAILRRPWTGGRALLKISTVDPEVGRVPLEVTIERDGETVREMRLSHTGWEEVRLEVQPDSWIGIRTSRTFQAPGDPRHLGVAVQLESLR